MFKLAANLCRSTGYWFLIFLFALSLEVIALYFQYQLGYGPCVLCVEIRAIVGAIMLIAMLEMLFANNRTMANIFNILLAATGAFFYDKADYLLRIERNLVESACGFSADFPNWLPLDKWLPSVFEPWEACGYTPNLWFNITMAEALVYCSIFIFALGSLALLLNLVAGRREHSLNLFNH